MKFEIEPYEGALPVKFGMSPADVAQAIGAAPEDTQTYDDSDALKNEYYPGMVRVHYDKDGTVDEVSFAPDTGVSLTLDGKSLFDASSIKNPLTAFLAKDDAPVDDYGFIVFEKIGVAVTGYHDDDQSQRAINVFREGRWTDLDQAEPIDLSEFK